VASSRPLLSTFPCWPLARVKKANIVMDFIYIFKSIISIHDLVTHLMIRWRNTIKCAYIGRGGTAPACVARTRGTEAPPCVAPFLAQKFWGQGLSSHPHQGDRALTRANSLLKAVAVVAQGGADKISYILIIKI